MLFKSYKLRTIKENSFFFLVKGNGITAKVNSAVTLNRANRGDAEQDNAVKPTHQECYISPHCIKHQRSLVNCDVIR